MDGSLKFQPPATDRVTMKSLEDAIRCLENLEDTTKRNEKRDLLRSAADNPILKEFFARAYDWQTTYGLVYKQPAPPKAKAIFGPNYDIAEEWAIFLELLTHLADRKLTGQEALDTIDSFMHAVDPSRAVWYSRVINRDLRVGVNVATFGQIWPDLRSAFEVSRALKFKDLHASMPYPVYGEPKIDGLRITQVFKDGSGVGKTRSGKEYNEVLGHIIDELRPEVGNEAIDGEIMADWEPTGPLSTYGGKRYKSPWGKTSAMLKTGYSKGVFNPDRITPAMWEELRNELKFWVFDYMSLDVYDLAIGVDKTPFNERRAMLAALVARLGEDSSVKLVPQVVVENRKEADAVHETFFGQGYEGTMYKVMDGAYFPDRTALMLKRKEEEFIDGVILEVLPGTGRNAKWAGSYRVRLRNGLETSCNLRGDKDRADHWERREDLKGCPIEMVQQKDPKAVTDKARFPTFARLRDDLPRVSI